MTHVCFSLKYVCSFRSVLFFLYETLTINVLKYL